MKTCTKCGAKKELKLFNKKSASRDGYQSCCKICHMDHYKKKKDIYKDRQAKYYIENKVKLKQQNKTNYENNKYRILERNKKYRNNNKERNISYQKKWNDKVIKELNPYYVKRFVPKELRECQSAIELKKLQLELRRKVYAIERQVKR